MSHPKDKWKKDINRHFAEIINGYQAFEKMANLIIDQGNAN